MQAQTELKTFLVVNGDWSAGWAWKMMHPLMCAADHRLLTPTYTGLGERERLASPSNDLDDLLDNFRVRILRRCVEGQNSGLHEHCQGAQVLYLKNLVQRGRRRDS